MPVKNGQGMGDCTPNKQRHFRDVCELHTGMCKGIIRRHHWAHPEYTYLDLFAGEGQNDLGTMTIDGSPVIMARELMRRAMINESRGFLFERKTSSADALRKRLTLSPTFSVVEGDHEETIGAVIAALRADARDGSRMGMVYCDPNGTRIPVELLRRFFGTGQFPLIDCVAYIAGTTYKRVRGAFGADHWPTLEEDLQAIGKRYIHLRVPEHRHQWTMAILTNYDKFPQLTKQGFYPLCSDEGKAIRTLLVNSDEERAAMGWKSPRFITEHQAKYRAQRDEPLAVVTASCQPKLDFQEAL